MKALKKIGLPAMLLSMSLMGCVDDNYDLSDIDMTVGLQVKDLVIPVNVDDVTLKTIFNIEGDGHVQVVDGDYVLLENGEFSSEGISIPEIVAKAPGVEPIQIVLGIQSYNRPSKNPIATDHIEISIPRESTSFKYAVENVDKAVVDIESAKTEFAISVALSIPELNSVLTGVSLSDLSFQLPKGLVLETEVGKYDASTGLLTIGDIRAVNNKLEFKIVAKELIFGSSAVFNGETHTLKFEDELALNGGTLIIGLDDLKSGVTLLDIPSQFTLSVDYTLTDIDVKSFTGKVKYALEGLHVDPIHLEDLPAILNQDGTNIMLTNPQIYLTLNNPIAPFKLKAQTGLTISSHFSNAEDRKYSLDELMVLDYDKGNDNYHFCLSPTRPNHYYEGYEDSKHVLFSTLGDVLSGPRLPYALDIDLNDAMVPEQRVEDFTLGVDLGDIHGKYTVYAPFSFKGGSDVMYRERVDGWNSEELDNLVVNVLEVSGIITSELPLEFDLYGHPIDKEGNIHEEVDIEGAIIPAEAKEHNFTMRITGEVSHLDGLEFLLMAIADESGITLSPDLKIYLKDLKVKVSGNYVDEL